MSAGSPVLAISCCHNSPGLVPRVHEVLDVIVGGHGQLGKVLDVWAHKGMLPHPQVPLVLGVQEVPHTLTVYLHVAHLDRAWARQMAGSALADSGPALLSHTQRWDPTKEGPAQQHGWSQTRRQWSAYLHRVGHVVIGCVIDAREEILTQLRREEPGCSASCQDAPAQGTQATGISTFSPQKSEPLSSRKASQELAEPLLLIWVFNIPRGLPWHPTEPAPSSSWPEQSATAQCWVSCCPQILALCSQTAIRPGSEQLSMTQLVPPRCTRAMLGQCHGRTMVHLSQA